MSAQLLQQPKWGNAADLLLQGCSRLSTVSERIALIERLSLSLGDALYPAFIQILCAVNNLHSTQSKSLLNEALVEAISAGRLPTGKLSAWGLANTTSPNVFGQNRSLGPVEYLCAWYSQPCGRQPLAKHAFHYGLSQLLTLLSLDSKSRSNYCIQLMLELDSPLEGALSSSTRAGLIALTLCWQDGHPPQRCISAFEDELAKEGQARLGQTGLFSPDSDINFY